MWSSSTKWYRDMGTLPENVVEIDNKICVISVSYQSVSVAVIMLVRPYISDANVQMWHELPK